MTVRAGLALSLITAAVGGCMGNSPATYTFRDEATGLTMDLPADWERRDPADGVGVLRRDQPGYLVRPAATAPRGIGIILVATSPEFVGPERDRPTIVCQTGPRMGDRVMPPETMRRILEEAARSAGGGEGAATLSPVEDIAISGHPAYRLRREASAGAGSGTFVTLQKEGRTISCFGVHDAATRAAVDAAFASLRFQ